MGKIQHKPPTTGWGAISEPFLKNVEMSLYTDLYKAHLTPGPDIYFNAFIHVNSPRAGADNPLETNFDVNRKPLSLCPFVASFKTISLKYDFKHILNDFIHVYSPKPGTDNPLGTKF